MKKKRQILVFWIFIILIAFLDGFSALLSNFPILGGIVISISNIVWEIIELALFFGLFSVIKKK